MQRKDTTDSPFGGRNYNAPSNMTRIGSGIRFAAAAAAPNDLTDGVATQDWKSVHVIFYADENSYTGLVGVFTPWRWYSKQPEGQSGTSNVEVGRWIPDFQVTAALDPTMVTATISSHYEWATRDAEKMYWQLTAVYDAAGNAGTIPTFVYAQVFGNAQQNTTVGVAVASSGGGGGGACCPAQAPFLASVKATHWSPADGAVVYTAPTQLTAAGFPFVVSVGNCEVLGLVVQKSTSVVQEYVNGHNGIRLLANAGLITIIGAGVAPFANTDVIYYLYLAYQDKAYTEATDSLRTEEIQPLNHEHTQPAYIVNDVAVVAASVPPGINAPSDDGIVMDGYKDIAFELYLLGGQTDAHANCTVTVKFQGSNDVFIGGVRQWVDLAVGYDLGTDLTAASWVSVGLTALVAQVDFDNWEHKRIRLNYSFDVAPGADHPGSIVSTERRKAL